MGRRGSPETGRGRLKEGCAILCDLTTLQTALRWQGGQSNDLLTHILPVADLVVKRWCNRVLETTVFSGSPAQGGSGPFAEIRDGSGVNELCLRNYPVRPIIMQGTLTQGSPNITGLASSGDMSTVNLMVRMPVTLHGQSAYGGNNYTAIPAFTNLLTVGSTTATMTANAALSGTFLLVFGLSVYLDFGALGGQGVNPQQALPGFAAPNSQIFMGSDYILKVDEGYPWGGGVSGGSESGILQRIGGAGSQWGAWAGWGFGDMGWGNRGGLTTVMPPVWPRSFGSIRIDYAPGWGVGAAPPNGSLPSPCSIPNDLTEAVCKVAAFMLSIAPAGVPIQAQAVGESVLRMISYQTTDSPEIGTIRDMLRRYRDRAW